MRQATAFIRQLGHPGRASACTRPTGIPAPRGSTPPCAPARAHARPPPGTVAWHPAQDNPPRPPLMPVGAPLRVAPPVRTLHPHDTIRTRVRSPRTRQQRPRDVPSRVRSPGWSPRPVKAAGPRPWAHFPRSCRDLYHTSRQPGDAAQVHRQAPCSAVSCRWAAAHPGAALGAWRVSPGAARAPSQTSARPLPQGRARRPSRSAPTTTGSSLNPKRHPDTGRALYPFTRPAMPIRYGRTPLRGPLKNC
jgi:hypothetical protein